MTLFSSATVLLKNTCLWLGNTPGTFKCLQKTEALIKGVIPPHAVEVMSASMAHISFCGMATEANNHLAIKVFTELIHYF